MRAVVTLALKDLKLLVRHRTAFFFTFIFPLLFGVGFGMVFQQVLGGPAEGGIVVAVIDDDGAGAGDDIAAILEREPALRVVRAEPGTPPAELVLSGEPAGAVVVEPGFAGAVASPFGGQTPALRLVIDPSEPSAGGILRGVLTAAGFELVGQSLMTNPATLDPLLESGDLNAIERTGLLAIRARLANIPTVGDGDTSEASGGFPPPIDLTVEDARSGDAEASSETPEGGAGTIGSAFELTYPQAAAWALVGCVTGFGLSLAGERSGGTLGRLLGSPIRPAEIIAGKALACFVTACAALVVLRIVFWMLGVPMRSLGLELLAGALTALAFVGLMILLATACRSEQGAEGFVRAVLLVLALVGGAGVPLVFFRGWVRGVTAISPFRWAIEALEVATWRQGDVGDLLVPGGVLLLIWATCAGFGWARFRSWTSAGA